MNRLLFRNLCIWAFASAVLVSLVVKAQDVSSVDVATMAAVVSSIDGPDKAAPPLEKSPDYVGVDLLAYWTGDKSPNVTRFHDRQSGVEFVCIRDRGCVLTGRKW